MNFLKGAALHPCGRRFMELIVISKSKLKIMLTSEDMRQYSLDCSTLDYENTETRRAFWSILDEAKHRTGFDAASEKVFVQVSPSKKGGCEMYVTQLGIFSEKNYDSKYERSDDEDIRLDQHGTGGSMKKCAQISSPYEKDAFCRKKKRVHAYSFDRMENMLCACRALMGAGYVGESSAYLSDGGFYLVLRDERETFFEGGAESVVREYGSELDASSFDIYISEHGRCICREDAAKILGELA